MPALSGRLAALTALALLAFAANSLLCRAALAAGRIDAASFTTLRIVAGAITLWLVARARPAAPLAPWRAGHWLSALALFVYAAAFSFAYVSLNAAAGALILFGAVQATMIGVGLWRGQRLHARQTVGVAVAAAGLVGLLLPGLSAPPLAGSLPMLAAGIAWGVYTLRGQGQGDPLQVTAGNFLRAVPFALVLGIAAAPALRLDATGALLAVASGALASGIGYAVWYAVLPSLAVASAAALQLSVPLLAAAGGVLLLDEPLTLRLAGASVAILGGIALVVVPRRA